MTRAAARLGAVRKERFDYPVLERMKGYRHQPPAGFENPLGRLQRGNQLAELVVHKNAQGLERARRRIDVAGARTDDGCHDLGKLVRRRYWRDRARILPGLVQPLLYLFVFGLGLGSAIGGGAGRGA